MAPPVGGEAQYRSGAWLHEMPPRRVLGGRRWTSARAPGEVDGMTFRTPA